MRVNDRIPEVIQRGVKRRFIAFVVLGHGHGHMAGQIKPITYANTIRSNDFFAIEFDNDTRPKRVLDLRMKPREVDRGSRFLLELMIEKFGDDEGTENYAEYVRWFDMSAAGQAAETSIGPDGKEVVKQILFPDELLPDVVFDLRKGRKSTGKYVPPKRKKGARASASGETAA